MAKQEGIGSHFETLTVHKLYLWPVRQDWQRSWNRAAIYMIFWGDQAAQNQFFSSWSPDELVDLQKKPVDPLWEEYK